MWQVDSDIMVRSQWIGGHCAKASAGWTGASLLDDALRLFSQDPAALTLSLPIAADANSQCLNSEFTFLNLDRQPHRVEVRACFMHLPRLLHALPLPSRTDSDPTVLSRTRGPDGNDQADGPRAWYRLLDEAIRQRPDVLRSYRGPSSDAFFVHPLNSLKGGLEAPHMLILDCVERGHALPGGQAGNVNAVLQGGRGLKEWLGPQRDEDYVFIVTGMGIPPGRILKALQSLARQKVPEGATWGAVVVWDGSDDTREIQDGESKADSEGESSSVGAGSNGGPDGDTGDVTSYIQWLCCGGGISAFVGRCTLIMPRLRRGGLANTVTAIRDVCSCPMSVMVLVDLDDSLIGDDVLLRLAARYRTGAEAVVGGMLRLGKTGNGRDGRPTCAFNLKEPRAARGGCVWSHLRTFRRYLFLRIQDDSLRGADGAYYQVAWDWAIMLPVVEMAWRPECWNDDDAPLYLYEPAALVSQRAATDRAVREAVIGEIVGRAPYARLTPVVAVVGYASYGHLPEPLSRAVDAAAEELGGLLVRRGYRVFTGGMGGVMNSCARGAARAGGCALSVLPLGSQLAAGSTPYGSAVPTGLGGGRNAVVACADAVIVVGGGAGTLDEAAKAWGNRRLVIALRGTGGQAERLLSADRRSGGAGAGAARLDHRLPVRERLLAAARADASDCGIQAAGSPAEAVDVLDRLAPLYRLEQLLWTCEPRPTAAL